MHRVPEVDQVIQREANRFQDAMLQGVSRTFALTIPLLPADLRGAVANAYLLCRIVDTIEDEPKMSAHEKHHFCMRFIDVVNDQADATTFANELATKLSRYTLAAEHELIKKSPLVLAITRKLSATQRMAISQCIQIMATGMGSQQGVGTPRGLSDLAHLDRYCYYVAGVVGEMLTRMFCDYSEDIDKNREAMMPLAVSFGQGLQMTNILKDLWDDYGKGACWLPRDLFAAHGVDLDHLGEGIDREAFARVLAQLVGVAHGHLKNALSYSILIPKKETGIRLFCLWAIAMALLTLRNIHARRYFTSGQQVKITRREVTISINILRYAVHSDRLLKLLFYLTSTTLPLEPGREIRGVHAPY